VLGACALRLANEAVCFPLWMQNTCQHVFALSFGSLNYIAQPFRAPGGPCVSALAQRSASTPEHDSQLVLPTTEPCPASHASVPVIRSVSRSSSQHPACALVGPSFAQHLSHSPSHTTTLSTWRRATRALVTTRVKSAAYPLAATTHVNAVVPAPRANAPQAHSLPPASTPSVCTLPAKRAAYAPGTTMPFHTPPAPAHQIRSSPTRRHHPRQRHRAGTILVTTPIETRPQPLRPPCIPPAPVRQNVWYAYTGSPPTATPSCAKCLCSCIYA
jgi:hypothetical protein